MKGSTSQAMPEGSTINGISSEGMERTVTVTFPGIPPFPVIAEALSETYEKTLIDQVQPLGGGKYAISFKSSDSAFTAIERGLSFKNEVLNVFPVDHNLLHITVKNAPFAMTNDCIRANLGLYGDIQSIEFEMYKAPYDAWSNGDRKVKMVKKKTVPNILKIGNFSIICVYRGVTQMCRRCMGEGHVAARCPKFSCFRCGGQGHIARNCVKAGGGPWEARDIEVDVRSKIDSDVVQDLSRPCAPFTPVVACPLSPVLSPLPTLGVAGIQGSQEVNPFKRSSTLSRSPPLPRASDMSVGNSGAGLSRKVWCEAFKVSEKSGNVTPAADISNPQGKGEDCSNRRDVDANMSPAKPPQSLTREKRCKTIKDTDKPKKRPLVSSLRSIKDSVVIEGENNKEPTTPVQSCGKDKKLVLIHNKRKWIRDTGCWIERPIGDNYLTPSMCDISPVTLDDLSPTTFLDFTKHSNRV